MTFVCSKCGKIYDEVSSDEDPRKALCNDCFVERHKLTSEEIAKLESAHDIEPE